jgi:hypothetical protein
MHFGVTIVATITGVTAMSVALTATTITSTVSIAGTPTAVTVTATKATLRCVLLEVLIVSPHFVEQLFAQFLCFLDAFGLWTGDVEEHGFITLLASRLLHKA